MSMTIMGDKTQRAVIQKSESHKLSHSFPVKKGEKVLQGQMVVLNDDGTIQGFKSSDDIKKVIGVAVTNSDYPAYTASKQYGDIEVTVALRGYAIVFGMNTEASLVSGPVKPDGNTQNGYAKYVVDSEATDVKAINLTPISDAANSLIQVLIL